MTVAAPRIESWTVTEEKRYAGWVHPHPAFVFVPNESWIFISSKEKRSNSSIAQSNRHWSASVPRRITILRFKILHVRSYKWPAACALGYNMHVENENLHIHSSLKLANDGRRKTDTS
jgi:hypothetical protein